MSIVMLLVVIGTQIVSLGGQSQVFGHSLQTSMVVIGTQIVSLGGQSQGPVTFPAYPQSCDWHSNCIFRWSITGVGLEDWLEHQL